MDEIRNFIYSHRKMDPTVRDCLLMMADLIENSSSEAAQGPPGPIGPAGPEGPAGPAGAAGSSVRYVATVLRVDQLIMSKQAGG
jgi:hypothetical protein